MSNEKNIDQIIKIKVFPLIGTPDKIFPELMRIRKTEKVIEEFINLTPFEQQQPNLQGIQTLAPQMAMLMCAFIVCEDNTQSKIIS